MKLILLLAAVVLWAIAAILALANTAIGALGPLDFFLCGSPLFAASFLPIP